MTGRKEIVQKISDALVRAGSTFRPDQMRAYEKAIREETNDNARWVMEQIIENAAAAERQSGPLCDDTGIPHIFIEVGRNRAVTGELLSYIQEGIAEGLTKLPGRPMAICGDDLQRIDQSCGISSQSEDVLAAPILIKQVDEETLRVHVIMQGGGPAIRGTTHRVFHKHSLDVVRDEIVARATESVKQLGCTPCTLAIGVGRSHYEATAMMMEAIVYSDYDKQTEFEKEITERVNQCDAGPLGLGGRSVLATFLKVGPQRASGVRIVSIRPCCCFEPRMSSVEL